METLFAPQIKGLRYLFYTSNDNVETFSYTKSILFFIYLFTMLFAFLQFSFQPENFQIECSQLDNSNCRIIPGYFGQSFFLGNYIILFLAMFLMFKDHISKIKPRIRTLASLAIQFFIVFLLFMLLLSFFLDSSIFFESFYSSTTSIVDAYLIVIEPILFFRGLIFILEIVSEDYSFTGYKKKTWIALIIDLVIILIIGIFAFMLNTFYKNRTDYSILGDIRINYSNVEIFQDGSFILFMSTIFIIIYYFLREGIFGSSERIRVQKSIIPYVTSYGILFLLIRGISGVFIWDNTLRSITSLFDIVFFLIILIIGIIGLINLPDNDPLNDQVRLSRPLTWLRGIPKYSKVLLLFFLGGIMFYYHLEQETIAVLLNKPNYLATQKIEAVSSIVIFGFLSVFLNFKPKKVPEGHIGPIKFLLTYIKNFLKRDV